MTLTLSLVRALGGSRARRARSGPESDSQKLSKLLLFAAALLLLPLPLPLLPLSLPSQSLLLPSLSTSLMITRLYQSQSPSPSPPLPHSATLSQFQFDALVSVAGAASPPRTQRCLSTIAIRIHSNMFDPLLAASNMFELKPPLTASSLF